MVRIRRGCLPYSAARMPDAAAPEFRYMLYTENLIARRAIKFWDAKCAPGFCPCGTLNVQRMKVYTRRSSGGFRTEKCSSRVLILAISSSVSKKSKIWVFSS